MAFLVLLYGFLNHSVVTPGCFHPLTAAKKSMPTRPPGALPPTGAASARSNHLTKDSGPLLPGFICLGVLRHPHHAFPFTPFWTKTFQDEVRGREPAGAASSSAVSRAWSMGTPALSASQKRPEPGPLCFPGCYSRSAWMDPLPPCLPAVPSSDLAAWLSSSQSQNDWTWALDTYN